MPQNKKKPAISHGQFFSLQLFTGRCHFASGRHISIADGFYIS
jgi:hypothetical protein